MKIAIVSDTHQQWENVLAAIQTENVDYLFFLGDLLSDGYALGENLAIPYQMVSGNCDIISQAPEEVLFTLAGVKFLLCHGHRYQVKEGFNKLYYRGMEMGVDIICFGHTHQSVYIESEVILINPGSASRPRSFDEKPSWGLLEIEEKEGKKKIIKYHKKDLLI